MTKFSESPSSVKFRFRGSQSVEKIRDNVLSRDKVKFLVVAPAATVTGQSQKKDVSSFQSKVEIKSVKAASCVNPCLVCPNCQ